MSDRPLDPVLQAVVRSAADATGAAEGWILVIDGDVLRAVAAAGLLPGTTLDVVVPAGAGAAGYAAASGEPIALSPGSQDPRLGEGVATALGRRPTSVLCVPCGTDQSVIGVLELVDKHGGAAFSFDDLELATILAGIAGVALSEAGQAAHPVPSPEELSGELRRLAASDPDRYAAVATMLSALFGHG